MGGIEAEKHIKSQKIEMEENLKKHLEWCKEKPIQHVILPEKGKNTLKFKDYYKTIHHPAMLVADFECTVEDIICDECELEDEKAECDTCEKKATKQTKRYKPIGYGLKLCSQYEEYDLPVESYFGEDCVQHFATR